MGFVTKLWHHPGLSPEQVRRHAGTADGQIGHDNLSSLPIGVAELLSHSDDGEEDSFESISSGDFEKIRVRYYIPDLCSCPKGIPL